jgi:hypothetical protein
VSRSAGFDSRRAFLVLIASIAIGLGCATTAAVGAGPAPTPPGAPNPFGLPHVISFKIKPATGATLELSCIGTVSQPCAGTIFAGTAETLQGKKVVAASSRTATRGRQKAVRIAQASFSLTGGQTATIQLKLNSTGLTLLRRFHTISAYILAGEVIPQGKFVFLAHEVLFKAPAKHR